MSAGLWQHTGGFKRSSLQRDAVGSHLAPAHILFSFTSANFCKLHWLCHTVDDIGLSIVLFKIAERSVLFRECLNAVTDKILTRHSRHSRKFNVQK